MRTPWRRSLREKIEEKKLLPISLHSLHSTVFLSWPFLWLSFSECDSSCQSLCNMIYVQLSRGQRTEYWVWFTQEECTSTYFLLGVTLQYSTNKYRWLVSSKFIKNGRSLATILAIWYWMIWKIWSDMKVSPIYDLSLSHWNYDWSAFSVWPVSLSDQPSLSDQSLCQTNLSVWPVSLSDQSLCQTNLSVWPVSLSDQSLCLTSLSVWPVSLSDQPSLSDQSLCQISLLCLTSLSVWPVSLSSQ